MAYSKVYQRINWENEPSTDTPINETNLNKMDYMLDILDTRTVELDTKTDALQNYETRASAAATQAETSATASASSATQAASSVTTSKNYSDLSKSYAVGTGGEVRPGDATDNAEYYYEQTKDIAETIVDGTFRLYNNPAEADADLPSIPDNTMVVIIND